MDNGTCIMFILFYVFRHYKRIGIPLKRSELISDLKKCQLLLKRMENNINPYVSIELVHALIDRINSFGAEMKFQHPLRYADDYDHDIIKIMYQILDEIIVLSKQPFFRKYSGEIFNRFLVLHNLPRVLLNNSSGDLSTPSDFHISKQVALEWINQQQSGNQSGGDGSLIDKKVD